MSLFQFTGRDAKGDKVSGSRESSSTDSLASELQAEHITPLTIQPQAWQGGDILVALNELLRSKRVELQELIIFCRQMYSLSKAGVPIISAIS
ncbi:MAG TPA: type II secretion system F family protein, partial [Marinobacter sp.]|nr:type II secretion system F family protein [Marinobacter sp.]